MDTNSTSNFYLQDILTQPFALAETLKYLKGVNQYKEILKQLNTGKLQRIILTGMGASFYAAYPAYMTLIKKGFHVYHLETAELIHFIPEILLPDTLIIAISQSGETAEVKKLIEIAKNKTTVIGITNTDKSFLAQNADFTILTQSGEERSVSCKTYITSIAVLSWIANILCNENSKKIIEQLEDVPEKIFEYLSGLENYFDELNPILHETKNLFILGRGVSLASSYSGALIIKEAAGFHAEGMSCATFRHGPLEVMSHHVLAVIYLGSGNTANLNWQLYKDIEKKTQGKVAIIQTSLKKGVFNQPSVSSLAIPIVEILPIQIMSIALAKASNRIPGSLRYTQKVTVSE